MFLYRIIKYLISINKVTCLILSPILSLSVYRSTPCHGRWNHGSHCVSRFTPINFSLFHVPLFHFCIVCLYQNFKSYLLTSGRAIKPRITEKSTVESPFLCQNTIDIGTGSKLNYFKWAVIRSDVLFLNKPLLW